MTALRARLAPVVGLASPWKRDFRYGLASGMTQQVLFIASATTAAYVVGRAVRGATSHSLTLLLLAMVIVVLPQVRTPWLEAISFQAIANRIQVQLRARIYEAIARLTPAGLDGDRSGELGSTAMADVAEIQRFFAETLSTLIVAAAIPAVALVGLACLSWPLALVLGPLLLAATTVPLWLHGHAEQRAVRAREELAALSADVVEQVGGLREALAFGATAHALERLVDRTQTVAAVNRGRSAAAAAEAMASEALATGGTLAVAAVGAALAGAGHLSPTLFAPCVVLAALAFGPTGRLVDAAKTLEGVAVAGQRVFALLARAAAVPDGARPPAAAPRTPAAPVIQHHVALRDVRFRYAPHLPAALDGVSFDVQPGETVALVGHSGAGKSTCANLLLRFWDVESGSVTVGGVDVRDMARAELHRVVGLVTQEVYLFTTTVRENLCLGRPDATDAEIESAAGLANAWEFIAALPDGIGTSTGERGIQLSGGQRQRVAIARAFLADPPVLILDEPLSNLDADNEHLIAEAMSRLRAGRTTLIVAHRLSTIRRADRIVVLDHGRLAGTGTHDELMAGNRTYAELVASQVTG